jgi:hypothetical protein
MRIRIVLLWGVLAVAPTAISGCVATSSAIGPDGKPIYFADGMTAAAAFNKASQQCPQGYELLGAPANSSFIDYKITYHCR